MLPTKKQLLKAERSGSQEHVLPSGTVSFGKEQWETYFGKVGEAPPIPANIDEILNTPCPYYKGKTKKQTHLLVLIPEAVNGILLNLNTFRELVKHPLTGNPSNYRAIYDTIVTQFGGIVPPEGSHWVLMTRGIIPGSKNKTYAQQQLRVEAETGYYIPDLLSAAVCILTYYVSTGKFLFRAETKASLTRCVEAVQNYQTTLGAFGADGIRIHFRLNDAFPDLGVAALQRLV